MNATVADVVERAKLAPSGAVGAAARRLRWRLGLSSLIADALVFMVATVVAHVVFDVLRQGVWRITTDFVDWSLAVATVIVVVTFQRYGLYRLEAYVSRPLHLLLLAKGTLVALVVTAFLAFAVRSPLVDDSRMKIFVTFGLFFVLAVTVRVRLLDRLYRSDVKERPGPTIVVGWFTDSGILIGRLRELRGFALVRSLQPADRRHNGHDADPELLCELQAIEPAPRQVILDGASLGHKAVLDLIRAARARGSEVYVTSRLVSPLDGGALVSWLFEMPAMRVRRDTVADPSRARRLVTRAFDVAASAGALFVLSPLFAAIALAVKLDSHGPVLFRQERVGLQGRHFLFLKFRSMAAVNDAAEHREALEAFISGDCTESLDQEDEYGRQVFKMVADSRVTRVGRFIRRYSLDELPQLWNVLRGEMSMVGPRPALPYEVAAYEPWHLERLEVTPGVSGLWQVAGRSRVHFDDMVFQDVMYGMNQCPLTDISLCFRTVPAVLMGTGAA